MKMLALTNNRWWYLGIYGGYSLCFAAFTKVVKVLPLGTAYATWCGVGTAGTVLIASKYFGEPMSWPKAACTMLTILGIIGLNLLEGGH
jgi:multidrug transporter EmrE-like cation transporter